MWHRWTAFVGFLLSPFYEGTVVKHWIVIGLVVVGYVLWKKYGASVKAAAPSSLG